MGNWELGTLLRFSALICIDKSARSPEFVVISKTHILDEEGIAESLTVVPNTVSTTNPKEPERFSATTYLCNSSLFLLPSSFPKEPERFSATTYLCNSSLFLLPSSFFPLPSSFFLIFYNQMSEVFGQITVEELGRKLAETNADLLQLVDVREPDEIEFAALPGFVAFPLSEFAQWSGNIDDRLNRDTETLVLCHHGVRSAQMCHWLSDRGFSNVKNIIGGIDAYSILVDRNVPRY